MCQESRPDVLGRDFYNNVEHLHLSLDQGGYFGFEVLYTDDLWNFSALDTTEYGVAWALIPEPSGLPLVIVVTMVVLFARRRSFKAGTTG